MKIPFLTIVMAILFYGTTSAQTFQWAKKFECVGSPISTGCYPYSITTDASGNVYSTGSIQDTTDFDPGPNVYNLAPLLHHAIFISKLDSNGNFVWAKSMGNPTQIPSGLINTGYDITIGPNGNVYVTGSYSGVVDFDPGVGVYNLNVPANNYYQRNFILKLDANGNFIWAKDMGSTNSISYSFGIRIDDFGNVLTAGKFGDTVDFDPGAGVYNLVSNGGYDVFISKLDSNGNFIWAKSIGGPGAEDLNGLDLDADNNILITGLFWGQCDFDPNAGIENLTAQSTFNTFILKLNSSGNFKWAKRIGDSTTIRVKDIYCDLSNNVYTTGYFEGTHDFNPGIGTLNLTAIGGRNTFISKIDSNGNFNWANQFSQSFNSSSAITGDALGNIFVTGFFRDSVDFDPNIGQNVLMASGNFDLFISKLNTNGNFIWAKQTLGGAVLGEDITVDSGGYLYTTGFFTHSVDFDPSIATTILSNSIITNQADATAFILKLKDCGNPTYSNLTQSACDSLIIGNQIFSSTGLYNVVIANSMGCDSVITLNLTIDTLDITISQNGTTLTANQSGAFYQWIKCENNTIIPGETNQNFTATSNGNYAVVVTKNSCSDTSTCTPIMNVSAKQLTDIPFIQIFPNPANAYFQIQTENILSNCNIKLTNVLGEVVYYQKGLTFKEKQINITNVVPGLYILEIETSGDSYKTKIIRR
jgi:hypothetical protein